MSGYSKCAVCGRRMITSVDFSGKPFTIQLCGQGCIGKAWREVTSALKEGRKPKLKMRKTYHKLSPEECAEAVKMYNGGMTKAAIAQQFGCCTGTIYRLIAEHQVGKD